MCVCVCVCVCVLFGPVKPDLGVIPSEQENHSKAETSETQNRMEINLYIRNTKQDGNKFIILK